MVPPEQAPYISPAPGEIPIIASSAYSPFLVTNNTPEALTKEMLQEVKDCGFNVAMESVSEKILDRILEVIEGTGLKFMPASSDLHNDKYNQFIDKYKTNPNICAWNFKDEPKFSDLGNVAIQYMKLRSADPSRIFFINLIGAENSSYTGDLSYAEYLDLIQINFAPAVWSYDLYPIRVVDGEDVMTVEGIRLFYRNLKYFSDISKRTNRPFWTYCQSMSFKNGNLERPAPKEAYLRYEAFSALACGAQGIVYWTYAQRKNIGNDIYITALIDSEGKKTEYWKYAQKVNSEIKKFTDVFLGCELIEIGHTGNLAGIMCYDYSNFGPFATLNSMNQGAMATLIKNKNKTYAVLVNHSPLKSSSVRVSFRSNCRARLLNPILGNPSDTLQPPPDTNTHELVLQPGAYLIYEYLLI